MESLPSEVIEEVINKLDNVQQVLQCSLVSASWAKVVSNKSLWINLCLKYFNKLDPKVILQQNDVKQYFKGKYKLLCLCKRRNPNACDCVTVTIETFDDLQLSDQVLKGIYSYGFEKPSVIQRNFLVPMMRGHDMIVKSQAGTGKTGGYAIAVLHTLDRHGGCVENGVRMPQALVLAPTRELAMGISHLMKTMGTFTDRTSHAIVGGVKIQGDIQKLKEVGTDILVGTPGRTLDFITRGVLNTQHLKLLIIDEADEVISRGFADQLRDIWRYLCKNIPKIQVVFLAATTPLEVSEVALKFMEDPIRKELRSTELTLHGIKQFYVNVEKEEWKLDTLYDLFDTVHISLAIVYCNTNAKVENIAAKLRETNFTVSSVTSANTPAEREVAINEFRTAATRIMITTDLTNIRANDISSVSLMINYDLPTNKDNYIHRAGRSGAYGRRGVLINFITQQDVAYLREIETHFCTDITELPADISIYL